MNDFPVRSIQASDGNWVESFIKSHWGSEIVVAKGRVIRPAELEGFAAFKEKSAVGLLSYQIEGSEGEIVTLTAPPKARGSERR